MSEEERRNLEQEDHKDIEIVPGNRGDLDISPVYEHLEIEKPTIDHDKKNIIIPEEKKQEKK